MFHLPIWGRWAMIGAALGIVAVSVIVVVCVVAPGCWLNKVFLKEDDKERKRKKKGNLDTFYETQQLSSDYNISEKNKDGVQRSDSMCSKSTQSSAPTTTFHPKASEKPSSSSSIETSSLLSSQVDSNYSSMSEYSGRSSPTVSYQSSVGGRSGFTSPDSEEPEGNLTFGIQYIANTHDVNLGKLVITVLEASGLSGREYLGTTCDAYVRVTICKERRSLRKQKSPPLYVFRTRTIRHSCSPTFNQSFIMDVEKTQLKDLVVRLTVMDQNKWGSPSTIGEATQSLKDIKNLAALEQRTTLTHCLDLPKLEFGEVLFGLSYLPTSQRLSVNIVKASNLHYQNMVEDIADFHPFVRVMLISSSGRLLKKKKTSWRSGTTIPVWNETLVFDVTQAQMEHSTFLLVLCTRTQPSLTPCSSDVSYQSAETLPDLSLSSEDMVHKPPSSDKFLGKVVLGCSVRDEESRNHWNGILANPRKISSHWHPLK